MRGVLHIFMSQFQWEKKVSIGMREILKSFCPGNIFIYKLILRSWGRSSGEDLPGGGWEEGRTGEGERGGTLNIILYFWFLMDGQQGRLSTVQAGWTLFSGVV